MTDFMFKLAPLPPIGDELYDHYPLMSAQTHKDLIEEYAIAAIDAVGVKDLVAALLAIVKSHDAMMWAEDEDKISASRKALRKAGVKEW